MPDKIIACRHGWTLEHLRSAQRMLLAKLAEIDGTTHPLKLAMKIRVQDSLTSVEKHIGEIDENDQTELA